MNDIEKRMSESEQLTMWFTKDEQKLLDHIMQKSGAKSHEMAIYYLLLEYAKKEDIINDSKI